MNDETQHYRQVLREQLPLLREQYGVASLSLFGSRLRGDHSKDSDLDVLVTFVKPPSLFRYIELEHELSDFLGLRVDLVNRDSLKPHISRRVLAEEQPV